MLRYQYSPVPEQEDGRSSHQSLVSSSSPSPSPSSWSSNYKIIQQYSYFAIFFLGLLVGLFFHVLIHKISLLRSKWQYFDYNPDVTSFIHISDTHIDYFFNPNHSISRGVCHSCDLLFTCPILPNNTRDYDIQLREQGYAFGRYGCNPPHLLFQSMIKQLLLIDDNPPVIVFTGDISPHAYPDDYFVLTPETTVEELCQLKFDVTKIMIQELVAAFPNTRWAYTLGNNDHFPKDMYWQPFITRYGEMLLETGFFTQSQYDSFISHGCSYIDVEGIRYLSIDMMIFAPSGIAFSNYSSLNRNHPSAEKVNLLTRALSWIESTLHDASQLQLPVYLIGHQPMTTKEGHDEMEVGGEYYRRLKILLSAYSSIIKVGLFGHHNYAFVEEIMSTSFLPLIPSIIAPGISPRGKNNPAFNIVYRSKTTGTILDFKQMKFDLFTENQIAKELNQSNYLGRWSYFTDRLYSWQSLSHEKNFTVESLSNFLQRVPNNHFLFQSMQIWRTGGYLGEDTPEGYFCRSKFDQIKPLIKCLFPEQNLSCWSSHDWLAFT